MNICESCGACSEDGYDLCSFDGGRMTSPFAGSRVLGERYLLEQRIAAGAMGVVFRARHLQIGSTVAVKLMQPRKEELQVALARFHREAQILGQIKHPNAVLVMDFGVEDRPQTTVPYLVTEFLRGECLEELLARKGRLSLEEVERILTPLCEAVEDAHRAGVVHRDIKPSNVFLERLRGGTEIVKVLDFGIAKFVELSAEALRKRAENGIEITHRPPEVTELEFVDEILHIRRSQAGTVAIKRTDASRHLTDEDAITEAGFIVGTLAFMAPEQITGGRISRQTDAYAIASLVFRMLSGVLPFEGTDQEVMTAKLSDERPLLRGLGIDVPQSVEEALQNAFALQPAERPESVLTLARAVAGAAGAAASTENALPLEAQLRAAVRTLSEVADAAQSWDIAPDQDEHYQRMRDGILALDAATVALRRSLAGNSTTHDAKALKTLLNELDDGLARVSRSLIVLAQGSAAAEYVDYLNALWARLSGGAAALSEQLRARIANPWSPIQSSPRLKSFFADAQADEAELTSLVEKLLSRDTLDSAEALESLLQTHMDRVVALLARGRAQGELGERLAGGLWRHADEILLLEMYPAGRPLRLLPLLANLRGVRAAEPFEELSRMFADDSDASPSLEAVMARLSGDDTTRVMARCLLLHPSAGLRDAAASRLALGDFWNVVVYPRTPLSVERAIFERVKSEAPAEYLKVFFLCVRDSLSSAAHADELGEAFELLEQFLNVPCFHEDLVFEPLLQIEGTLRERCRSLDVAVPAEESYSESLAAFCAGGVTETQAPTRLNHIPLPIQRRLARDGYFTAYFVSHTVERVAMETLRHLFRMEDITRFLRIPTIHRAVLVELVKNKRFFRKESARLALLQNPKTPAHVARQFLPFIGLDQLKFLAANRHIGADVRQLAEGFVARLMAKRS